MQICVYVYIYYIYYIYYSLVETLHVCSELRTYLNTAQHTATHCNTLQHTATHCNTLQHIATHCNTLQHIATHCNTLQHTATHCNTLQHTHVQQRKCTSVLKLKSCISQKSDLQRFYNVSKEWTGKLSNLEIQIF